MHIQNMIDQEKNVNLAILLHYDRLGKKRKPIAILHYDYQEKNVNLAVSTKAPLIILPNECDRSTL